MMVSTSSSCSNIFRRVDAAIIASSTRIIVCRWNNDSNSSNCGRCQPQPCTGRRSITTTTATTSILDGRRRQRQEQQQRQTLFWYDDSRHHHFHSSTTLSHSPRNDDDSFQQQEEAKRRRQYGRIWRSDTIYNVEDQEQQEQQEQHDNNNRTDDIEKGFHQYWNQRVIDYQNNSHHNPVIPPSSASLVPPPTTTILSKTINIDENDVTTNEKSSSLQSKDDESETIESTFSNDYNNKHSNNSSNNNPTISNNGNITNNNENIDDTSTMNHNHQFQNHPLTIDESLKRIIESQRGEMRQRGLGVLNVDPAIDIQLLTDNYTVKAVASALRDREDALQQAALLSAENKLPELQEFLQIFHPKYVLERRKQQKRTRSIPDAGIDDDDNDHSSRSNRKTNTGNTNIDPVTSLRYPESRNLLRKALMRMPRTVTTAHSKRAGVCIALCIVDNQIPSILLERRAVHLRNFPGEVCLPGGMVCDIQDQTIVSTSIREMNEEIGGLNYATDSMEVLGILRLNWGEVQYLTGVAVTPVVCYLGELPEKLYPNPDEVSEIFTIPLMDLLNRQLWVHQDGLAPIFVGGPYIIWGLTGYILERLAKDILLPSTSVV